MSELNKRRYEVQAILKSAIETGLAATTDAEEAALWKVAEFGNAALVKADGIILMRLIGTRERGWQWREDGEESDTEEAHKIEEQRWQLHFIRKRTADDDDDAYVVSDIASNIQSWFNGRGCDFLRKYNISNSRIDLENIFEYNDDSSLYQKRVVFTLNIFVPKIIITTKGE